MAEIAGRARGSSGSTSSSSKLEAHLPVATTSMSSQPEGTTTHTNHGGAQVPLNSAAASNHVQDGGPPQAENFGIHICLFLPPSI